MRIAIGSDHAGIRMKVVLKELIKRNGHEVEDQGTHSEDSVDYPDFAHLVSASVVSGQADFGVLICGSGNGICMTANRHKGIRAALCWLPEIAVLARSHNNANVLCLPARFIDDSVAEQCMHQFLSTGFEGGRHASRIEKIDVP